ncbi:MAG: BsuPI-related putative proteinase inhibitor [Eubacteriales bacterium]|nr:BsuPI-related putative proteinase inhibitor [Eubacteriales bacterium]
MDLFRKHLWKCIMIVFFLVAIIGLIILINPKETVNAENNGDTVTLSKNTIDYNRDLRNEELLLKMTDGRHYEEKEPGPLMGENWEGRFVLQLLDDNENVISQLDLNQAFDGEALGFQYSFDIEFEDYNNDNCMDFTIGQFASSNGNVYRMFTITPDDGIEPLKIKSQTEIFSSGGDRHSTKFEKRGLYTLINRYYDNSRGEMMEAYYLWDEKGKQFVKKQEPEDMPEDEVQNKSNLNRDSDMDNEQDGKPHNLEGEEVDLDLILDDKPQKENQIKFETDVKNEEDVIVVKPVQTIKAAPEFMEWAIKEKEESQKLVTGLFETILDITHGDDSVKLDLSLKNISEEDLKFYFSSGQRFDIFITGHEGEEVYRWSHDKCFTMAIIDIDLKKGEKLSFLEVWDYLDNEGNRVQSGKYSITVKLLAKLKNGKTISPDELTAVMDIEVK